jgi:Ice-binding-like
VNRSRYAILFKPVMWFMALLLAALVVAGCGGGGGDGEFGAGPGPGSPPTAAGAGTGVGGQGRGPAPVPLGTAGNFAILSVNPLTNRAPSVVTGDVGLTNAGGALIGLTCAEVTGTIYAVDNKGPGPCTVMNPAMLAVAKTDGDTAYNDAIVRVPDYLELADGNIGGLNLGPATYQWNTGVTIPTHVWLTGGPNDVWIFRIAQGLSVSSGVQIILAGGARSQNVYWAPAHDVDLGTNSQFKGVLLPAAAVFMRNGASINGRLLAEAVHLDQNTVTQPAP